MGNCKNKLHQEEIEISIPCDSIECRKNDTNCQKIKSLCKRIIVKNEIKYIEIEFEKNGKKINKILQEIPHYDFPVYPPSLEFGCDYKYLDNY